MLLMQKASFNTSVIVMTTPITRRKRQKFVYRVFTCKISCHYYYVITFWQCNDDRKFYMRKHYKRIFAVFYV